MKSRQNHAFTLMELLVVISLIVLLIAMLQPAMNQAKKTARTVKCASNIDQMATGMISLSDDFHGRLFPITHGATEYWHTRLLLYVGNNAELYLCPEATADTLTGWHGDVSHAWGPGGGLMNNMKASYGMNLWLLPNGLFSADPSMRQEGYIRQSDVAPSDTPVFGDSPWVGSWPDDQDFFPANLSTGHQRHAYGYFMGRFCIDRHNYAINVSFMDGSAQTVRLPDLWKLRWHNDFTPGDPGAVMP
jgi:prepilin-type N-terminal cleavage/methylation domain-containing protein